VNIKEYISGGFIENYVLGLASKEEREEFEQLCKQHPELIAARDEFEKALEQQLLNQAVLPANGVKDKVMDAIRQQPTANQTKIITMENVNTNRRSTPAWAVAAVIILLISTGFFGYKYFTMKKELDDKPVAGTTTDGKDPKSADPKAEDEKRMNDLMADPKVAVVNLSGLPKAPGASAKVLWDSTADNVYLVIKNMPKLQASDKQYQLWSIINGQNGLEPTDMGLFDVGDDGKIMLKIDQRVKKADAFAITVEQKGNATGKPNLNELQVLGTTPKTL
jgi:anti-sigma-K factor RskA